MLSTIDLAQILLFPVKDSEARKRFLIACAIILAGFVVPVLPYLFLMGYAAQIARQVFNGEAPRMIAWENWDRLLQDGARMFGARLVYSLPLLLLLMLLFVGGILAPILLASVNESQAEALIVIWGLGLFALLGLMTLLSLPLTVIIPAAEMHVVAKSEFAAGFRFREWAEILRANFIGFVLAAVLIYAASMAFGIVIQILIATLILACLLPFLLAAFSAYFTMAMYALFAQAYKLGRDKLAETSAAGQ